METLDSLFNFGFSYSVKQNVDSLNQCYKEQDPINRDRFYKNGFVSVSGASRKERRVLQSRKTFQRNEMFLFRTFAVLCCLFKLESIRQKKDRTDNKCRQPDS